MAGGQAYGLTSLLHMDRDRLLSSVSDFSRASRTFGGVPP